MTRNPNPNRELDPDPYWYFNEQALTDIVKIRSLAQYFHQSSNQCPNCGANCWEAEEPPMVFRGCACALMAFPPGVPLHDYWESNLWGTTVAHARKAVLKQLKRELAQTALHPN
jgi:hypothetical protein